MISGLDLPTTFAVAPDGKVFVAEQRGIVKEFSSFSDTHPSIYADLRTNADNYEDRGLLGLAVDPNWPTAPNVYALYTYDGLIGGKAPLWGTAGDDSDPCPDPYGNGCTVSARLSRLQQGPVTTTAYTTSVSADSPAAYWRLGEASGTTAADASGNGHGGSYVGSPTLGVSGALVNDTDTAVAFNGSSQYVEVPYASSTNAAQFTVEAWAYVTGGAGTYRAVVTSRDNTGGPTKGYTIYAGEDNTWQLWLGNGTTGWAVVHGPPVQPSTWTHLVATYDGTAARLFVNGIQAADALTTSFQTNTSKPLRIAAGGTEGSARYLFPGRVDEVAVYSSVLSPTRIHSHFESATGTPPLASETVLINDWCQQYTSESIGTLRFGPDGALYAGGGPGASFTFDDYGQNGNPCGDPPSPAGTNLSPPTAEGGSLRSQDLVTTSDPTGLDGAIIRVDPATGAAEPDNPLASSSDANARRIVAYGLRNPFRFAFRPGTNELWIGDVGGGSFEEIDRVPNPLASPVLDFGWPCYEGSGPQTGFQSLNLNICNTLYNSPGSVTAPYFQYAHAQPVSSSDTCQYNTQETAISGIAFIPASAPYPSSYQGDLLFTDYGRGCIWMMSQGSNGLPDTSTTQVFASNAGNPVDLQIGPDNKVYYVDIGTGTIHRIDYTASAQPPTAVATANPTSGTAPLTVNFDGSGSSAPNNDPLAYSWDLNGDGVFGDSTAVKPSFTYQSAGTYTVKLRVTDTTTTLSSTSSPITISVSSSSGSSYASTVLADSPAAYWRLGEASGTTAADSSGNSRNGSYVNAPTLGLAGALTGDTDTAVGFNGTSQYMQVPYASALNTNTFSVEAWVYPTGGAGSFRSVVTSRDYTGSIAKGFALYASDADRWEFWLGTGAGFWNKVLGPAVTLNQWTHLVATYDGTTARLYVNGVQAASANVGYVANGAQPLRAAAGATEAAARYLFPGRLDEVAVYGSALSATRVQAHYNAGKGL